ncbi:MAG: glycosyltransferase family 4 protein [Lacibacter sp.]
MKRLAIITTHPIQYNAPLFRLLNERGKVAVKVFYTWSQSKEEVYDARFGMKRSWDIPLLDGYDYEFIDNSSRHPDSNRFWGIINPGLVKKIKAEKFDAVLVYRWSVFSHFRIMQQLGTKPKLFFRGDSVIQNNGDGMKQFIKKNLLKWVYRKVDKAFYVGRKNKNYFQQYGLNEDQLIAAPHAVENERFSSNKDEWEFKAKEEREKLSFTADTVVFIYAGKFYELKQLDVLIQAFKKLNGQHYRLLLFGNGEQENELKDLAGEDDRIIFQPFKNQSEMPWVYRMGDVFVLTSKSETWGLGVNEAMACGRAAIVSDHCGCAPELIIEGKTGYLFRTGITDDLFHCMQQFTNRDNAMQMGKEALKHIEHFSLEKIAEVIEEEVIK